MPETDTLQAWMQAAILSGAPPPAGARAHVRGDNLLTAEARVAIYTRAYRARLTECLRGEYPLLAALAGPTAFDLFAQGYIAATPSQTFTLYDFGARFADYLAASRPSDDGSPQAVAAIPAAMARIERAKAEVSRARGIERRGAPPVVAGLDPAVAMLLGLAAKATYRRPDSVRLLVLPFDFMALLSAAPGTPLPLPDPAPSLLAVARVGYRVSCHRLQRSHYDWLAGLPAIDAGPAADPPGDPQLVAWLPQAEALGLVIAD